MINGITAVIIDSDAASSASLKKILTESVLCNVAGEARDFADGHNLISREKPNLIVIELEINKTASFGFIERISRENPGAGIIATSSDSSSENILRAIRSGCSEFLLRPVSPEDLAEALKKIVGHFHGSAYAHHQAGKVITCSSPKGGSGCTTVAVNIAAALNNVTGKEVLLVDLDLEGGCADVFLDLKPRYSIADAVKNIDKLDQSFLQGIVSRHSSGISLLSCPRRINELMKVDRNQLAFLMAQLKRMFQYVIVDIGGCYDETGASAIKNSDLLIVVGALSLPAIGNIQKALEYFSWIGFSAGATKLLINRFNKKDDINLKEAEKVFGKKVTWQVPNSYIYAKNSMNKGQPLVTLFPASEAAKAFTEVAMSLEDMSNTMRGIV